MRMACYDCVHGSEGVVGLMFCKKFNRELARPDHCNSFIEKKEGIMEQSTESVNMYDLLVNTFPNRMIHIKSSTDSIGEEYYVDGVKLWIEGPFTLRNLSKATEELNRYFFLCERADEINKKNSIVISRSAKGRVVNRYIKHKVSPASKYYHFDIYGNRCTSYRCKEVL